MKILLIENLLSILHQNLFLKLKKIQIRIDILRGDQIMFRKRIKYRLKILQILMNCKKMGKLEIQQITQAQVHLVCNLKIKQTHYLNKIQQQDVKIIINNQKKRTQTSVLNKKSRRNSNSPQIAKGNYINAEQKQMIKANFKKVQLSLKKITGQFHKQKQLKYQRNSYTILPKQQSFKKFPTNSRSALTNPRYELRSFTKLE